MKYIGMLVLIVSSTGVGLLLSDRLRVKTEICKELEMLCDEMILDMSYNLTGVITLLERVLSSKRYLGFISSENLKNKVALSSPLSQSENSELSSFLYSLGKTDVKTQIKLIEGFRRYIENSKKEYQLKYTKNSKLYISYGAFFGIVVSLIAI